MKIMKEIMHYLFFLSAIVNAQFTKKIINRYENEIIKNIVSETTNYTEKDFIPVLDERTIRQPINVTPKEPEYKQWGSPPKFVKLQRGILRVLQWSEISTSGSGKIGNGFLLSICTILAHDFNTIMSALNQSIKRNINFVVQIGYRYGIRKFV